MRILAVSLFALLASCGARSSLLTEPVDRDATPTPGNGPTRVVQLVAGYGFTCALESSGAVRCWGFNESGALGDGTTLSRAEPRPVVGLDDAVALAAADHRVCALRRGGRIACWGSRHDGSTRVQALTPEPETSLTGVLALAVHAYHMCAIDSTRHLVCWGRGTDAELGGAMRPYTPEPVRVEGIEGVTAAAVGESFSCAIDGSARTLCWGASRWGAGTAPTPESLVLAPRPVAGTEGATTLAAGYTHACVIVAGGEVRCWGQSLHGAAGIEPSRGQYAFEPTTVGGLEDVVQIDGGISQNCALQRDGHVGCWGSNSFGQLGAEGRDSHRAVRVTGLDDAVAIASGEYHNCALRAGGAVVCWGAGGDGQLGPRRPSGRSATPVEVIPAP